MNEHMQKLRDEALEKHRTYVPIDPESPLISKFANSLHREVREGFVAGFDACFKLVMKNQDSLGLTLAKSISGLDGMACVNLDEPSRGDYERVMKAQAFFKGQYELACTALENQRLKVTELQAQIEEMNKNCISLNLHESRMKYRHEELLSLVELLRGALEDCNSISREIEVHGICISTLREASARLDSLGLKND